MEDPAVLEAVDGNLSLAQVFGIKRDVAALQVFNGTRGISTNSIERFLGDRSHEFAELYCITDGKKFRLKDVDPADMGKATSGALEI